jgi:hypothetical protein
MAEGVTATIGFCNTGAATQVDRGVPGSEVAVKALCH